MADPHQLGTSDLNLDSIRSFQLVELAVHLVETGQFDPWYKYFKTFAKFQIFTWRHKWGDYFEIAQVEESHPHGEDIRGIDSGIVQLDHSPGTGMKQYYI